MTGAPELLARLVGESSAETEARRSARPMRELERLAGALPAARDFAGALRGERLAVIAEMKARTPVMGSLSSDYRPRDLASAYTLGGASALSVLCQATSFGGSPDHLVQARAASPLPILRKDFVSDEYQVAEARALGADAVLLIVAALEEPRLRGLVDAVSRFGLQALVEVHSAAEVEAALAAGARVIGVNHRDLRSFQVDIGLTEALRPLVPPGVVLVAESGIHDAADARRMRGAGADAVLVGESLMRSSDPATLIRALRV